MSHLAEQRGFVRCTHEHFAHQHGIRANAAQRCDIGGAGHAGFRNVDAFRRNQVAQAAGVGKINGEVLQIAVG